MGNILSILWNEILVHPILNILLVLYHSMGDNLGLAVIAFTVIVRLVLIPSTVKQMDMSKKMQLIKPKLEELQKKYANNQEKLASEQLKLYKENNYNPLGCFTSFIPQLVLVIALYNVFRFVVNGGTDGIYPFIKDWVGANVDGFKIDTSFLNMDLALNYKQVLSSISTFSSTPSVHYVDVEIINNVLNSIVGFFNVYLIAPFVEGKASPYYFLALAIALIQYSSTKFMQEYQGLLKPNSKKTPKKFDPAAQMSAEDMQEQMSKSMNLTFPIMTFFISMTTPAVLSIAWLVQSIMIYVQYFIVDRQKFLNFVKSKFEITKNKVINFYNKKSNG